MKNLLVFAFFILLINACCKCNDSFYPNIAEFTTSEYESIVFFKNNDTIVYKNGNGTIEYAQFKTSHKASPYKISKCFGFDARSNCDYFNNAERWIYRFSTIFKSKILMSFVSTKDENGIQTYQDENLIYYIDKILIDTTIESHEFKQVFKGYIYDNDKRNKGFCLIDKKNLLWYFKPSETEYWYFNEHKPFKN